MKGTQFVSFWVWVEVSSISYNAALVGMIELIWAFDILDPWGIEWHDLQEDVKSPIVGLYWLSVLKPSSYLYNFCLSWEWTRQAKYNIV